MKNKKFKGRMKLEFHGDLVTIHMPIEEKDEVVKFLDKYRINYEEVEITRLDGNYIRFSFYASETIKRLFNQFYSED